jgi:hypothetical protein
MILGISERRETYAYMLFQALAEHLCDISALGVGRSETLCPANELAVIDTFLPMGSVGNANRFGNDTTYEHGYEN